MTPSDYLVKDVHPWTDENGEEIKDTYGNHKLSITLEGVGEPADMTAKNLPEVGSTEYGHLQEYQTKAGKTRVKFMRDKKEEESAHPAVPYSPTKPFKPSGDKYYRDATTIPLDVYRVLIGILGVPEDANDSAIFWEKVKDQSNELLAIIETIRKED